MDSGATSKPAQSASSSDNGGNEAGDFECNICLELAQDPVLTLCGHLYCWPCLYRWLRHHSHCHECPVCKALIQEEKLVPLYGRGKTPTDPRSKSYPGIDIPHRPSGQRPETAPPPEANQFANYGLGFMGGLMPMAYARIGNFTLSTAFGGLIPALFNVQFHGFQDATVYGTTSGYPYGFNTFHGGHAHGFPQTAARGQQADTVLKNLLLLIGVFVVLALLCWWSHFGISWWWFPLTLFIVVACSTKIRLVKDWVGCSEVVNMIRNPWYPVSHISCTPFLFADMFVYVCIWFPVHSCMWPFTYFTWVLL